MGARLGNRTKHPSKASSTWRNIQTHRGNNSLLKESVCQLLFPLQVFQSRPGHAYRPWLNKGLRMCLNFIMLLTLLTSACSRTLNYIHTYILSFFIFSSPLWYSMSSKLLQHRCVRKLCLLVNLLQRFTVPRMAAPTTVNQAHQVPALGSLQSDHNLTYRKCSFCVVFK